MSQEPSLLEEALARRVLPEPPERRAIRLAAGISQRRLATALGVSPTALRFYESGRSEPRATHLTRYCELLLDLARLVAEVERRTAEVKGVAR